MKTTAEFTTILREAKAEHDRRSVAARMQQVAADDDVQRTLARIDLCEVEHSAAVLAELIADYTRGE